MKAFHYKDVQPEETLTRIQSILDEVGISLSEDTRITNNPFLHSLRISHKKSFIATNGKGLSLELALASAYAELMERLQNQFLAHSHLEMTWAYNHARNVSDFIYSPDEVCLLPDEYIDSVDSSILRILAPIDRKDADPAEWLSLFTQDDRLFCVPFFDLIGERTILLPMNFVRFFYRATGMCAGNSIHEALVQGLCEVVERHVMDIIYHDKIAPPLALSDGRRESPVLKSLIDGIESILCDKTCG